MAEFNPLPQAQPPGSYVGLSEGIRSSPNTAIGALFEGLASTLDAGIKEQDRNIKANIEKDIFDEVDAVQAEFGVPDATDLEADADEASFRTAPAGVQRAKQQLDVLQTAYERGALKESHYWARMNNMVRQLRGKYPGYRGEIDQMVSSVTGARPANALRSALMSEWEAEANKESSMSKLVDWATKNGRLPVDYYVRESSENPYTEVELASHVASKTRHEADIRDRQLELAHMKENDTLNVRDAERAFRLEASHFVTTTLQDASTTVGTNFQQVQAKVREAQAAQASGKPLPQAEVDQLRGMMGQLQQDIRTALHQKFLQSWDGDPNHSYAASGLDKTQMEAVIAQAMVPLDVLNQSLSAENPYGVLGATSAWLEAQKFDSQRELLRDMPFAQKLSAVSQLMGADAVSLLFSLSPTSQVAVDEAMKDYWTLQMAAPDEGTTMSDAVRNLQEKGRGAESVNSLTTQWTKMADQVAGGEIPLEAVQGGVKFMFGPGSEAVLSQLDDESRFLYFKKVSSPMVSKQMMALRDQGDVESWQMYSKWTANVFQVLFRQQVESLQNLNAHGIFVDWSPQTSSFTVTTRDTQQGGGGIVGRVFPGTIQEANRRGQQYAAAQWQQRIQPLNDAIRIIEPLIKDAKGDTSLEMLELLTQMGFLPSESPEMTGIPSTGRPVSLVTALIDAIRGSSKTQEKSNGSATE